jgi:hypothetical protein
MVQRAEERGECHRPDVMRSPRFEGIDTGGCSADRTSSAILSQPGEDGARIFCNATRLD